MVVIQHLVGQRCLRWALSIPALLVSLLWRDLDLSLHSEQNCTFPSEQLCWCCCEPAGWAGCPWLPSCCCCCRSCVAAKTPMLPPGWGFRLDQGSWMRPVGLDLAREKSFCWPLSEMPCVFAGSGTSYRASLNLASKSNFKGNHLQISNCLLVLMLKAPCIPPVAMLSSPWNYFQHVS